MEIVNLILGIIASVFSIWATCESTRVYNQITKNIQKAKSKDGNIKQVQLNNKNPKKND